MKTRQNVHESILSSVNLEIVFILERTKSMSYVRIYAVKLQNSMPFVLRIEDCMFTSTRSLLKMKLYAKMK